MSIKDEIAQAVEADLTRIRAILGDDANLNSPKLDEYHRRYCDAVRQHWLNGTPVGSLRANERKRIWAEICEATASPVAA